MDKRRKKYMAKQRRRTPKQGGGELGPCDCGCGGEGVRVPPGEVFAFLEANRTEGDVADMKECQHAQARGDAATALDAYRRGLHIDGSPQEEMLETLVMLGPMAPPWILARWIVSQAYGWMLLNEDPRTDEAVRMTLACCYSIPEKWDPQEFLEFGTSVGACDWVAHELATYDLGGLADFVDVVVDDEFKEAAPMIEDWVNAPLRPYRYESSGELAVRISDLNTGEELEVIDRGCLDGSSLGAVVLGRVVPALPDGPHMFASRPLAVDEITAYRAGYLESGSGFPGWLLAVGSGFHDGRIPEGVGRRTAHVLDDRLMEYLPAS